MEISLLLLQTFPDLFLAYSGVTNHSWNLKIPAIYLWEFNILIGQHAVLPNAWQFFPLQAALLVAYPM